MKSYTLTQTRNQHGEVFDQAQIAKKTLSLKVDPLPTDSKQLPGYSNYYRVDSGEYRIVYRYNPEEDLT